ncbi:hypothetical protein IW148_001773 [Coemansia sp. RSA 1199]|nr:hypothetical protein IW148_001773 [Coemansia sp. RSA 1199]
MSSHIPLPKDKHNKSKLFVTRSPISSKKHERSKLIQTHPFNHQISIISQSTTVQTLEKYIGPYYQITLKLSDLIDPAFIANYIKRNTLIALCSNRFIDADDVFAIDGQKLILSVGKDTYETLGLVGRHAQFPLERGSRFVIEIDLLADCMDPEKKYFQRVRNRFDAVLHEPVEFIVGYFDKTTGTPVTFDVPGATIVTPQFDTRTLQNAAVPSIPECLFSTNEQTDTWTEHAHEMFEWIGLAANCSQAILTNDSQTSAYSVPEPNSKKDMQVVTVRGLLSATAIHSAINELIAAHTEFYVCVWGFDDAPVSWNSSEHNFYVSGENMYAQAYVPQRNCCLSFQACGPWDAFS